MLGTSPTKSGMARPAGFEPATYGLEDLFVLSLNACRIAKNPAAFEYVFWLELV